MIVIKTIYRFFAKLLGWLPWAIFRRTRFYHEDAWNKERPLKGPAIVICNHSSLMDYFTMMFTFPFRKVRTLVSEALYDHRVPGLLSKGMDDIVVHRERSDMSFMEEAEKALKNKQVVAIYPEGHLSKNGEVDIFKPAAVYLALKTGAPIIPMYVEANYNSIKRTRVIVGKRIYLKDYCAEENPSIEKVKELCGMLREKVLELRHLMRLYVKMGTQDFIKWKSWFLDIAKVLLYFPKFIVYPTKFHYINGATKKDRELKGRGIICAKHFFFNDGPFICVNYMKRRVRILVAAELSDSAKWLVEHLGTIRYDRSGNGMDTRCFMEIINYLRANGVVGIFPEGHITDGELLEIQEGVAYFSMTTNAPIHFFWTSNSWKAFHINHVFISKTIYPSEVFIKEEMKDKNNIQKLHKMVEDECKQLQFEAHKFARKPKEKKSKEQV